MSGFVKAGFSFLRNIGKGKVSPTIKSVKPSVGKTKHQKTIAPLEKAHSNLRQTIQKMKGEPTTKSGISKGKDIKK